MNRLPPWLGVQYPFAANTVASTAGNLNYVDEGQGPAVVMFHGNPTWSFLYRNLILALRPDCRCLALDNLGCGLSEKPQQADYSLAAHVERAADWVESTGVEDFHLVVHDWGGPIGLGAAARMQDRVRSISILNTAAFSFKTIPFRIAVCRWPFLGALLVRGANGFVRAAKTMTTVEPLPEGVQEGFAWPYGNWHDRVAIHRFVRDIPMSPRHRSWKTLKEIEASLPNWRKIPVQILWGMQDWCFHVQFLKVWREILPEAEVVEYARAGHYVLEDVGEEALQSITSLVASRASGASRP